MANQEQNPTQQEQPFVAAKQVGLSLEDIILNTNNEVALLYPEHANKETFKCVSVFISKCCLREPFTRSPNMYKKYLAEFWYSAKALENSKVFFLIPTGGIYGEVWVNIFRNVIGAHYLPHFSEYVTPPSIDIVRPWLETIWYGETVSAKGTLKKSLLPPRWRLLMAQIIQCLGGWGKIGSFDQISNKDAIILYSLENGINIDYAGYGDVEVTPYLTQAFNVNNWALKPNQPEGPPFTDHMLAICSAAKPVVFKAPKPSSNAERVSQGIKPRAQLGHKKHSTSLKQPSKKDSSSTVESNPSQTLGSTPVVTKMHKEDQQATGGPNSLGVAGEEREDPQLSSGMSASNLNKPIYSASFIVHSKSASGNDALADSTTEADPRKSVPSDFIPQQQGMNERTKNTSYDHLLTGTDPHVLADQTQSVSKGLETVLIQSKIDVVDDSDEDEEADIDEGLHATSNIETKDDSVPTSSSPKSSYIKELTNQWELPAKFLFMPTQVEMVQSKLKTLDALPSLLNKVINALNQFAEAIASKETKDASIPSAGQADTQPAEG
ncbi:hypothetical protein Tco_0292207 [Tanacetum coccineum]